VLECSHHDLLGPGLTDTDTSEMPITFICPNCQCKMTVPDTLAGKRGKCSKCKGVVIVPGATGNGPAPATPPAKGVSPPLPSRTDRGASASNVPSFARPPASIPPKSVPPEDVEAAAHAALADEPAAEKKVSQVIEFECPMCFEPLKLPLDLGGKKHPCPHCKRIIAVPRPKAEQATSWRDAGPKLPSAARRDDGPAPEGAWGSSQTKGPSLEGLKQAGVIPEKHKPLTVFQKAMPFLLFGSPLVLLVVGGYFLYGWMGQSKEKQALDLALRFASADTSRKAVGAEGVAALHGAAARYHVRSNQPGSASQARDELNKAVALARDSRNSERDALLIDLVGVALDLAGSSDDPEADPRVAWDTTQKALHNLLAAIAEPQARLEGLRRAAVGLAEREQAPRALALAGQVFPAAGADRAEAFGVVGLELFRLGNKIEAINAARQTEAVYAVKKNRPLLRPSVVALDTVLQRPLLPPTTKGLVEQENIAIGKAEGQARLGNRETAYKEARDVKDSVARFRAWAAIAIASADSKQVDRDAFKTALESSPSSQPWLVLHLIAAGARADIPIGHLEPAATALPGPLAAWAQLLILRSRLRASDAVEADGVLLTFPADSLAARVARLELSRHNTHLDRKWADTVNSWETGQMAFGSLGVALALQKGK
jgi:hypothetical protein